MTFTQDMGTHHNKQTKKRTNRVQEQRTKNKEQTTNNTCRHIFIHTHMPHHWTTLHQLFSAITSVIPWPTIIDYFDFYFDYLGFFFFIAEIFFQVFPRGYGTYVDTYTTMKGFWPSSTSSWAPRSLPPRSFWQRPASSPPPPPPSSLTTWWLAEQRTHAQKDKQRLKALLRGKCLSSRAGFWV